MIGSPPAGSSPSAPTPRSVAPTRPPVFVFELSGQRYGLPLREVTEVVPMAELARAPCQPALLDGFLNLGGTAIPVVRLAHLFGLPERLPGLYTPLLILGHASPSLALRVEEPHPPAADADVVPVRGDQTFNGSVEGVVTAGGEVVLLLSAELLLLDKEQQVLAEFQDREQERLRSAAEALP